jgi:hypothetical protein
MNPEQGKTVEQSIHFSELLTGTMKESWKGRE